MPDERSHHNKYIRVDADAHELSTSLNQLLRGTMTVNSVIATSYDNPTRDHTASKTQHSLSHANNVIPVGNSYNYRGRCCPYHEPMLHYRFSSVSIILIILPIASVFNFSWRHQHVQPTRTLIKLNPTWVMHVKAPRSCSRDPSLIKRFFIQSSPCHSESG